jgi:oxygen-independent coproporphyrinogen-3 oxidase
MEEDLLCLENGVLKTSEKGRFLVDGIASDLFMLN